MKSIIITVLGIAQPRLGSVKERDYEGVQYEFEDGKREDAEFFVHALSKYLRPDLVVVLATDKAEELKWPELREWLELDGIDHELLKISSGKNKQEAWSIFNTIVGRYNALFPDDSERPEVFMDMTNGLRSMPVLLLSVARYLQRARDINFGGIYYGAFDSVDRSIVVKPVYRLDSFMTVLDLAGAVEVFLRTGDGRQLADVLEDNADDLEILGVPDVAEALRALSDGLDLLRPEEVMSQCYKVLKGIEAMIHSSSQSRAIGDLLMNLYEDLQPLALPSPRKEIKKFLLKGLALINWYYSRYRYIESVGLAREWFVTYRMFRSGKPESEIFSRELRKSFEESSKFVPSKERDLWTRIKTTRNDIAHSGMSNERASSADLISSIAFINSELQKLKVVLS